VTSNLLAFIGVQLRMYEMHQRPATCKQGT
jgi:hypothetical protein